MDFNEAYNGVEVSRIEVQNEIKRHSHDTIGFNRQVFDEKWVDFVQHYGNNDIYNSRDVLQFLGY